MIVRRLSKKLHFLAIGNISVAQPRLYSALLTIFSAATLILAALGIYGVVSFEVKKRTREIVLRMALGAPRRDIWRMVVARGLGLAAVGVAFGIGVAVALTHLMEKLLYSVSSRDPLTYLGASLLVMGVAAAACYLPARRATRLNLGAALHCE
jgi:ABC-type antimicrobial peptide transport system permease subunit